MVVPEGEAVVPEGEAVAAPLGEAGVAAVAVEVPSEGAEAAASVGVAAAPVAGSSVEAAGAAVPGEGYLAGEVGQVDQAGRAAGFLADTGPADSWAAVGFCRGDLWSSCHLPS